MKFGLLAIVLALAPGIVSASGPPVEVVMACHIANTAKEYVPADGDAAIRAARMAHPDLGGNVFIYLHNRSDKPVTVTDVSWNGLDAKAHLQGPNYDLMWWRSAPKSVAPGTECEVALCLRESLKKDTTFVVDLGDAGKAECEVKTGYSGPRLATVAFSPDLRSAYLYVEAATGAPNKVYMDGNPLDKSVRLMGGKTSAGLAVIKVTPAQPFRQGARHLFRVCFGKRVCAGSVRAFGDLARFGAYGLSDPKLCADAGLDSYTSFVTLDEKMVEAFGAVGIKTAVTIGPRNPDPWMIGNPNIYGYLATDEPDCGDYSKGESRPMHLRLGTQAQALAEWSDECEKADPSVPTFLTVDQTFAPQNYFAYARVANIAEPDCYTVVLGWPLTVFRDKMSIMKRASAPQPFFATYQAEWEENAVDNGKYISAAEIARQGSEKFVDRTKIRGFGRAPSPEEVRIPMLYAIGDGAHGLYSFTSATESCGDLFFHGGPDIPEVWQAQTTTTRQLRVIAPLIQIGHPTVWCKSDRSSLWVRTLVCGDQAALVVAVNEACESKADGFVPSPVRNARFSFDDMPWLDAAHVYLLGDGKLDKVKSTRVGHTLVWSANSIADGEIYLVCSNNSLAADLVKQYYSTAPHATAEGMRIRAESYLKGRRKTPGAK